MSHHRPQISPATPRRLPSRTRRAGFTIVEIVVAFVIIGILVSIMTPIIANRAEEARVATCQADLEGLTNAMERVAVDTGYLVRLDVLDDLGPVGADANQDGLANTDPDNIVDGILDNPVDQNNFYTNGAIIFISPTNGQYFGTPVGGGAPTPDSQDAFYGRIQANETGFNWNGPYLNFRRDDNLNDWPEDPWGNDYLFFTEAGVIYPAKELNAGDELLADHTDQFYPVGPQVTVSPSTGGGSTQREFEADIFDRFTILSTGPNGLPGAGTDAPFPQDRYGLGDDIIRQF